MVVPGSNEAPPPGPPPPERSSPPAVAAAQASATQHEQGRPSTASRGQEGARTQVPPPIDPPSVPRPGPRAEPGAAGEANPPITHRWSQTFLSDPLRPPPPPRREPRRDAPARRAPAAPPDSRAPEAPSEARPPAEDGPTPRRRHSHVRTWLPPYSAPGGAAPAASPDPVAMTAHGAIAAVLGRGIFSNIVPPNGRTGTLYFISIHDEEGQGKASAAALRRLRTVPLSEIPADERECTICYEALEEVPEEALQQQREFDAAEAEAQAARAQGERTPERDDDESPVEAKDGHAPLQLPCKHSFGASCVRNWLQNSSTCPLCRTSIEPSSGGSRRHVVQRQEDLYRLWATIMRPHAEHRQRQNAAQSGEDGRDGSSDARGAAGGEAAPAGDDDAQAEHTHAGPRPALDFNEIVASLNYHLAHPVPEARGGNEGRRDGPEQAEAAAQAAPAAGARGQDADGDVPMSGERADGRAATPGDANAEPRPVIDFNEIVAALNYHTAHTAHAAHAAHAAHHAHGHEARPAQPTSADGEGGAGDAQSEQTGPDGRRGDEPGAANEDGAPHMHFHFSLDDAMRENWPQNADVPPHEFIFDIRIVPQPGTFDAPREPDAARDAPAPAPDFATLRARQREEMERAMESAVRLAAEQWPDSPLNAESRGAPDAPRRRSSQAQTPPMAHFHPTVVPFDAGPRAAPNDDEARRRPAAEREGARARRRSRAAAPSAASQPAAADAAAAGGEARSSGDDAAPRPSPVLEPLPRSGLGSMPYVRAPSLPTFDSLFGEAASPHAAPARSSAEPPAPRASESSDAFIDEGLFQAFRRHFDTPEGQQDALVEHLNERLPPPDARADAMLVDSEPSRSATPSADAPAVDAAADAAADADISRSGPTRRAGRRHHPYPRS